MIVNIVDYGNSGEDYFVDYEVLGLTSTQMEFLNNHLEEKTAISGDIFKINMIFSKELYPFQSDTAKFRMDDFIAREEIEMNVFLSGVLEDL